MMREKRACFEGALVLLTIVPASLAPGDEQSERTDKFPVCKVTPQHTGVCQIGMDHILGRGYTADDRMPFVIYSRPTPDLVLIGWPL